MPLPLPDRETLFAELWQDLPAEPVQMARACKAFVRAKQVKTPVQRWRVVCVSCGLAKPWREVAGPLTALDDSMPDQNITSVGASSCVPVMLRALPSSLRQSALPPNGSRRRGKKVHVSSQLRPSFAKSFVPPQRTFETIDGEHEAWMLIGWPSIALCGKDVQDHYHKYWTILV